MKNDLIHQSAELILNSAYTICLSGAGISAPSGIDPFRGKTGLWERYNPEEYASISSFTKNPEKSWLLFFDMYQTMRNAKPNAAHFALAQLEKMHLLKAVITQNIDGLHQTASTQNLIELHGNIRSLKCMKCANRLITESLPITRSALPPYCSCGGVLKPDVVLFGELIASDNFLESYLHAQKCKLMLLIGCSGLVYPANRLPIVALQNGSRIIEINIENSELSNLKDQIFIQKNAAEAMPEIMRDLNKILSIE